MYSDINIEKFTTHHQRMMVEIHSKEIVSNENYYGYSAFNIIKCTFYFYIDDYAVFLAYFEVYGTDKNTLNTIHLGIKSAQNFMSFWDHLSYSLSTTFQLNFTERETNFFIRNGRINKRKT